MSRLTLITIFSLATSMFAEDLENNLKPWGYKESDHRLMSIIEATQWLVTHPSVRPTPQYGVGDAAVAIIAGRRFNVVIVNVFWDGYEWKYVKALDWRIEL